MVKNYEEKKQAFKQSCKNLCFYYMVWILTAGFIFLAMMAYSESVDCYYDNLQYGNSTCYYETADNLGTLCMHEYNYCGTYNRIQEINCTHQNFTIHWKDCEKDFSIYYAQYIDIPEINLDCGYNYLLGCDDPYPNSSIVIFIFSLLVSTVSFCLPILLHIREYRRIYNDPKKEHIDTQIDAQIDAQYNDMEL